MKTLVKNPLHLARGPMDLLCCKIDLLDQTLLSILNPIAYGGGGGGGGLLEPFHLESPKCSDFFFIPFGHILVKL